MFALGHVGITLFLYAPVAYVLDPPGEERGLGTWDVWVVSAAVLTLLPDFDVFLPGISHRGVTHTLSAAILLGVAVTLVCLAGTRSSGGNRHGLTALGFAVGAGSVVSHLLGDVITPMGVRPFFPASRAHYTLDLVYARNVEANLALFVVGVATFWAVRRRWLLRAEEHAALSRADPLGPTAPTRSASAGTRPGRSPLRADGDGGERE